MRYLIIRLGAFGDMIIITPVIRRLKQEGHEVYVLTSERGRDVLKNNPHIDKLIFQQSDTIKFEEMDEYWEKVRRENKCDAVINFCETIEVALAVHPRSPRYKYPKYELYQQCNRNYYEYSLEWAKLLPKTGVWTQEDCKPELFFTEEEIQKAKGFLKPDKFNVLMCMSGSGKHKVYPWGEFLVGEMLNNMDVHIITVGDMMCKIIEARAERVTNLAGEIDIRLSMALSGLVDLVVSPDTGVLHSAGCYETPKIGLLGHTTIENITKHFENDLSVESDHLKAECSPCFKMIYDMKLQCPVDPVTGGAFCMSKGIAPEVVYERVKEVYGAYRDSLQEV